MKGGSEFGLALGVGPLRDRGAWPRHNDLTCSTSARHHALFLPQESFELICHTNPET
jgi:hypothetical protein